MSALLGAALYVAPRAGNAQILARETVLGHEVQVARDAHGAIALISPGGPPIALGQGGDATRATLERVAIGQGAIAVIVRTQEPSAGAVVGIAPGRAPVVLFSGPLTPQGEPGDQRTAEIVARDLTGTGVPSVVVGERDERLRVCGAGRAFVAARVVDPASLRLLPVTINPLRADLYGQLPPARVVNVAPVASPFDPSPASVAVNARFVNGLVGEPTTALTDRGAATAWSAREREFVTATVATAGFRVTRIVLTAPAAPAVLPSTLTLLAGGAEATRIDVTVPQSPVIAPGATVSIPLVPAVALDCLSLVVTGRADTHHPTAIAELALETEAGTGQHAVTALVGTLATANAEQAAQLLLALGPGGIDALAGALATLDRAGATHVLRALAASNSPRVATTLVGALGRPEIAADVRATLRRMGAAALGPLQAIAATDPHAAELIATATAPLDARLRAVVPALGAERAVFHEARRATLALVREAVRDGALDHWLAALPPEGSARVRGLLLAAEAATDDAQRRAVAAQARALRTDAFGDRFRLMLPLAGDAEGRAELARVATDEPEADLRTEAVIALGRAGDADVVLTRALTDEVARVRAAAANGLAGRPAARAALAGVLARDSWPSVRAAAAAALAGDGESLGALVRALDDASPTVVRAVIAALSRQRGPTVAPALLAFAEDAHRNPELRRDAVTALADRCEHAVVERLERLAASLTDPALPPPEQDVGHAALAAVAHIDPVRARALFARMQANEFAAAAMERAMRNACPTR